MAIKWDQPNDGWIIDTLRGRPAFSDGGAMFVGKRAGKTRTLGHKKYKKPFDWALRQSLIKRLRPTRVERRDTIKSFDKEISCVVLRGETWIQEKYYDYALTFKEVAFFLGKKHREEGNHTVICKVGKEIVGVIMPCRVPK